MRKEWKAVQSLEKDFWKLILPKSESCYAAPVKTIIFTVTLPHKTDIEEKDTDNFF